MTYKLLASALHHPDSENPYRGLFNNRSLQSLAHHKECSVTTFAPVPYAPPIGPRSEYWDVPIYESFSGYNVIRPRFPYLLPKSLLYGATGLLYRRKLQRSTTGTAPDILHGCHVFPDGYGLSAVARSRDIPLTVMCHGYFLNNFSELPPGVATQVRKTLSFADRVFCVSDALSKKAKSIISNENIFTVPIGADPENFPTEQENKLRESYEIDPETTVILFSGQFIRRKGIKDIIDAIDRFPKEAKYVFIGHSGDLKDELAEAINSERAPPDSIIMTNIKTSVLREWYAIADLLLLPSYSEGRPTVIYEAMAAETAVLSSSIEGISEQVVDGETGVLIQPGDKNNMTQQLEMLVNDRNRLSKLGNAGRQRLINKRWTWSNHAEHIIKSHHHILNKTHI